MNHLAHLACRDNDWQWLQCCQAFSDIQHQVSFTVTNCNLDLLQYRGLEKTGMIANIMEFKAQENLRCVTDTAGHFAHLPTVGKAISM